MKKSLLTVLSLLLSLALLAMPLVVSASTAEEDVFDPYETMWYSVDFVRTSAAKASDDAYVYTWTPTADGVLTLKADTDSKDTYVSVVNTSNNSDAGVTLKYYPKGGYSSTDDVTYNVKGGVNYKVSVMTCSEASGNVCFFAYYTATSAGGLVGAGTYSDPYILDDKVKSLPALGAGETYYYLLSCDKTSKFDLTVKGTTVKDSFDVYIENNKSTVSAKSGVAAAETITPFAASGYIMFSITNNSSTTSGGYTFTLAKAANADSKGTYEDPATLVLDTLTKAKIADVCYYYTYTADEDGTLSVKISDTESWVCSISGGSAESAYCKSTDTPVVNPVEYPVAQGDEITLWVATAEFGAGTVSFTASLVTVEETTVTEPLEQETTTATEPIEKETTSATEPKEQETTTATEPIEKETTVSTEPVEKETTTSTEPLEQETTSATEPVATTSATTPTEDTDVDEEGAFSDINEDYCLSVTPLTLGDNEITVSKVYPATLFEFTPEEYAEYRITASDADALVGAYAGTINYIPDSAKGTSNEVSIYFSSGRDIVVAVMGTSSCTLTIEKVGDVEIKVEAPWNEYVNKVEVTDIETDVDINNLTNVMIYDDVANFAVLGADGYYHLDSADGEILYVNLNSSIMSLVDIVANGKLGAVFYDEQGNVTEKIDFTNAVFEYIDNAAQIADGEDIFYFYPLTADLIEMYQVVGLANDWYGLTGWVGGETDDAWMFACYYEEGVLSDGGYIAEEDPVEPVNPSAVQTGQSSLVAYVSVAAMLIAAVVFVVARKKASE